MSDGEERLCPGGCGRDTRDVPVSAALRVTLNGETPTHGPATSARCSTCVRDLRAEAKRQERERAQHSGGNRTKRANSGRSARRRNHGTGGDAPRGDVPRGGVGHVAE
jgi:hypothetical protein